MQMTESPQILDYLDYRAYLKDRLDYLQTVNKKYSQRWIAMRAGFKAPQLLSMIIAGQRNLTKDKAADLAQVLKLSEVETEYFHLIIELAHTETQAAQTALLAKIKTSFHNGFISTIPDEGVEIFRDWYYPAIREIVMLKECDGSPAWIAGRLGITTAEAETALETLLRTGFLKRGEDGKLVRCEASVGTNKKIYPIMLGAWHLKMLERAFGAVALKRDRRHLSGMSFAVSKGFVPVLKAAIDRFIRETDALVESQVDGKDEVFHIHVEMFPLTKFREEVAP
jgi:uncharacterized protein (TIGR02147 family)